MNQKKYLDIRSNLLRDNRLLKLAIVAFAAASIISSIASYKALNYSRTIIVPSAATKQYEVSDSNMSAAGIKMFTRHTFDLYLNYTPKSAKERFNELLTFIHTRHYDLVKDEMDTKLSTISRMHIVSTYLIEEIKHNEIEKKIKVRGQRRRTTYSKVLEAGIEEWTLSYKVMDSQFKIMKIQKGA